jgi:hypothetical protein
MYPAKATFFLIVLRKEQNRKKYVLDIKSLGALDFPKYLPKIKGKCNRFIW